MKNKNTKKAVNLLRKEYGLKPNNTNQPMQVIMNNSTEGSGSPPKPKKKLKKARKSIIVTNAGLTD